MNFKRERYNSKIIVTGIIIIIILLIANIFVWFVFSYPAKAGYISYETSIPQSFNLIQAELLLENENRICEIHNNQLQSLRITDTMFSDFPTQINIVIDEENNQIHIDAHNDIRNHLANYLFEDLMGIERNFQEWSERRVIDVIETLELSLDDSFVYRDRVDGQDYSVPFLVIYLTLFIDLIIIVSIIFFIMYLGKKKQIPREPNEPPPPTPSR